MWKRRLTAVLFGAIVVAALVALRAADPYPVRVARETTFDLFQQIRPRPSPPDLPISIVDIDEASLAAIGQWPWSRQIMASIARRLTELGAAAVAFDILFAEPDRLSPSTIIAGGADFDAEFAAALANTQSILVLSRTAQGKLAPQPKSGFAMTGADPLLTLSKLDGVAAPLPSLLAAASGLGVASLDQEGAGVARRLPLVWSNGTAPIPTLALEALRVAQGISTTVLMSDSASTFEAVRVGDFTIPTDPSGNMWLYYRHLPDDIYIPAKDMLADSYADLAQRLSGHIVFVGTSATGLLDIRQSPLGEAVPGVSIHVQALEQMLTGIFLQRSDWVGGLELLVVAIVGAAIALVLLLSGPMVGLLFAVMAASVSTAASWFTFTQAGVLLDPSYALFAALGTYAAMAFFRFAVTDADKRRIRRAFAHYVEPSLLARLETDESLLRLGGDLRELTVMFSDVRNFSALSERTAPADLVTILNGLFAALGAAIVSRQGTIDKFMGDAVMAFWNAPIEVLRHPLHACQAALAMRQALVDLNAQRAATEAISIGIGLATGPALVGNIGFEKRFDYSCIGDTVNLASRLESACKYVGYDILVTAKTRAAASELAFLPAGVIALKGMSEPEPVYLLVGDAALATSPDFRGLTIAHQALSQAFATGSDISPHHASCQAMASIIDRRLTAFYDTVLNRVGDFATVPATPHSQPMLD